MDIEELGALAEPFLGIALPAFLFLWFVLRPLSAVYRIRDSRLEVLTFFVSRVGSINLADVARREIVERRSIGSMSGFTGFAKGPSFLSPACLWLKQMPTFMSCPGGWTTIWHRLIRPQRLPDPNKTGETLSASAR